MRKRLRLFLIPLVLGAAGTGAAIASTVANAANSATTAATTTTSSTSTTTTTSPTTSTSTTTSPTSTTTTSSAAALRPIAKTLPASSLSSNAVTLSGTVNPNGSDSTCYFVYGETTAYGLLTAGQLVKSSPAGAAQTIGARLVGLQAKQAFHYELFCTNAAGSASGGDVSFATTDRGPSQIRLSGHTAFVSTTGTAGVFVGCYGDRNCTGSLRLTHNGQTVGQRSFFFIFAQTGGIVHVPLSPGATRALRSQGQLDVTVSGHTTDGQPLQGGDAGLTLRFHLFR